MTRDLALGRHISEEATRFVYPASVAPSADPVWQSGCLPHSSSKGSLHGGSISCFQGTKEGPSVLLALAVL